MRFGVSTYSFWQFRAGGYPVEKAVENAARMGFDGVEVLERQLGNEVTTARLHAIRRQALTLGVDLYAVSTHQDFVHPNKEDRQRNIDTTIRSLEVAAELGANVIRINSGRWKTIPTFDGLMDANGVEPPLSGYSDDDAFKWVIDSIEALVPEAEKRGVILGLENHWGLTYSAAGVKRIVSNFSSPYVGVIMDTGNFRQNSYEQLEQLAEMKPVLVHAKTYYGGGKWYTLDIDYARVNSILAGQAYRGYVSLEMEGQEEPEVAVPKSLALFKANLK